VILNGLNIQRSELHPRLNFKQLIPRFSFVSGWIKENMAAVIGYRTLQDLSFLFFAVVYFFQNQWKDAIYFQSTNDDSQLKVVL